MQKHQRLAFTHIRTKGPTIRSSIKTVSTPPLPTPGSDLPSLLLFLLLIGRAESERAKALPSFAVPPYGYTLGSLPLSTQRNLLTTILLGIWGTGRGGPWPSTTPDVTIKSTQMLPSRATSLVPGSSFSVSFCFCYCLDTSNQSACLKFQPFLEDLRCLWLRA